MNAELRKRLEEAAEEYARKVVPDGRSFREELIKEAIDDFKAGTELGYKEALAQAKGWLEGIYDYMWVNWKQEECGIEISKILADFEADMLKLLEEQK